MSQTPPPNPSDQFSFPPPDSAPKGSRVQQQGVYEMVWDCQFCGAKGIPAKTHPFCPNCGSPQATDSRRFPSDAEKKAVDNYEFKGVSLICPACQTVNDGDAKFCRQCGAPLESAAKSERVGDQVKAAGAQFAADTERNVQQEELDADLARAKASAPKKGGIPWLPIIVVAVIALVVIGIVAALTWKRDVTAQV
ncbi:MAG TPA: zinc ribbon domain-containing protein, partial [Candidatus Limnocylindrales bacterium]|nr:zinc ribbon domain-containing protein [Candidatus Limnocylindrales bacterium]